MKKESEDEMLHLLPWQFLFAGLLLMAMGFRFLLVFLLIKRAALGKCIEEHKIGRVDVHLWPVSFFFVFDQLFSILLEPKKSGKYQISCAAPSRTFRAQK